MVWAIRGIHVSARAKMRGFSAALQTTWDTFVERTEEVTFPAVSTLSVTMSSVLEEGLIFEEPKDLLEFEVRESNVLGEEWLNALVEVVEVEVEVEQVDAGSVMVRRVYTRQEAMNPVAKVMTI